MEARFYKALLIRQVEETLLTLFSQGKVNGTVHTCIGQEFVGVALAEAKSLGDFWFSNHRGHGHFLSFTSNIEGLIAEVMGKVTGVSQGVGGSQHLYTENYLSNGIQGGMVPVAAGTALAFKEKANGHIAVVFIGDGTLGEGSIYEAFNLAAKWELPLLVVLENNAYAQSTATQTTLAGSIQQRAEGFGLHYFFADTWNVDQLFTVAQQATETARSGKAVLLEVKTYRLKSHSKGDDNRAIEEIQHYETRDPLTQFLQQHPQETAAALEAILQLIDNAIEQAEAADPCQFQMARPDFPTPSEWTVPSFEDGRFVNLLYETFQDRFDQQAELRMIGEDIEGEYGGAFKVTKDLSLKYPGRLRNTPISESTIIGVCTGLAINGFLPLAEIMFGDFMTLTLDQLLQHASKFCEMYGRRLRVPMIVRTPMGGKRGYGPTHSQSIEKFFLGIPNLDVLALNIRVSPRQVYNRLFNSVANPTLVIENKILYTRPLRTKSINGFTIHYSNERFPTVKISPIATTPEVTIACYGGVLEEVEVALQALFDDHEILCEVLCLSQIYPLNIEPIAKSVRRTQRLLTIEEGTRFAALSSEIAAQLQETGVPVKALTRLGYDGIIPSSFLREMELLPNSQIIVDTIQSMTN